MDTLGTLGSLQYQNELACMVGIGGRIYIANGREPLKRVDVKTRVLADAGMLPPVLNPVVAAGAAGGLTGVYQCAVTEYDQYHDVESNIGAIDQVTTAGQVIAWSVFPPPRNPRTTHYRLYRTVAGDAWPVMAMVAQIDAVAPPAAYNDQMPDADLDFDDEGLAIDNGSPPCVAYLVPCRGRLFGWGQFGFNRGRVDVAAGSHYVYPDADCGWNRCIIGHRIAIDEGTSWYDVEDYIDSSPLSIYINPAFREATVQGGEYHTFADDGKLTWSSKDRPESWPAANMRYIAKGQGLHPSGIGEIHGYPVMFFSEQTWMLQYGDDPADTNLVHDHQLSGSIGCVGHRTIAKVNLGGEYLVWLSRDGFAATAGGSVQLVTDPPGYGGGMRSFFAGMSLDAKGEAQISCAVNHKTKHLYICALPTYESNGGCDKLVVWDYKLNNVWVWRMPWEIYSMASAWKFEKDAEDETKVYRREVVLLGTEHGYVMYWPAGECEAADRDDTTGTLSGTVSAAAEDSLTDDSAAFMVEGGGSPPDLLGLEGAYVTVHRESTDAKQTKKIVGNSAQTLDVEDWDWTPQAGDKYWVGGIECRYKTPRIHFDSLVNMTPVREVHLVHNIEAGGTLKLTCWKDQSDAPLVLSDGDEVDLSGATDKVYSDRAPRAPGRAKIPVNSRGYDFQLQFGNEKPDEPWTVKGLALWLEGIRPE